jgi:hypothetical protein
MRHRLKTDPARALCGRFVKLNLTRVPKKLTSETSRCKRTDVNLLLTAARMKLGTLLRESPSEPSVVGL